MRRDLLAFDVDPPLRTVQADHDVARLATLLSQSGGTVTGVFASEQGDELAIAVEVDQGGEWALDPSEILPRLRLRSTLVDPRPARPPAGPAPPPRLAAPDPRVEQPRPTPWQAVEIDDQGQVTVTYSRGIVERLHSVDAVAEDGAVRLTVWVGRAPSAWTGPVPAVGVVERTRIRLPIRIVDGAVTNRTA